MQQRQDWKPPQIRDLKLVITKHCTFLADNTTFIALGIPEKYLEKTVLITSTLPPDLYKISLDLLPRSLSLHYKQVNKIKNELDVFNYEATSPQSI